VTPKPVTRSLLCDADDDDVTAAIQRRGGATTQTDLGGDFQDGSLNTRVSMSSQS